MVVGGGLVIMVVPDGFWPETNLLMLKIHTSVCITKWAYKVP